MTAEQEQSRSGRPKLPPRADRKLMVLLPLVGFASGILTVILMRLRAVPPFAGMVFGAAIGGWLVWAKALTREGWAWFTLVATGALFFSACAAILAQVVLGHPLGIPSDTGRAETMPGALFVGGFVGGLLLLGALSLIPSEPRTGTMTLRGVIGALCGGLLGKLGAALTPSLGIWLWNLLHTVHLAAVGDLVYGDANFVCSLFVVWQTGIATVIGLMLLRYQGESESTATVPKWFEDPQDSSRTQVP